MDRWDLSRFAAVGRANYETGFLKDNAQLGRSMVTVYRELCLAPPEGLPWDYYLPFAEAHLSAFGL